LCTIHYALFRWKTISSLQVVTPCRFIFSGFSGFVQSPLLVPVSFSPHLSFRFRSVPTSRSGFFQSPLLIPVSFSPHFSFRLRSVPTSRSGFIQSPLLVPVSFSRPVPTSHSGFIPVQVSSPIIRCNSPPARLSPRMKFVTTMMSSWIPQAKPLLEGITGYNECKVVQPKAESAFKTHYHKPRSTLYTLQGKIATVRTICLAV